MSLRDLLKGATARPWRRFDRGGVRAVMKGNEPPLKSNGYHNRRWPEIVAWSGFDGSDVPERYRSANLRLIVGAVNALEPLLDALDEASAALDLADGIISVNMGIDTPPEWNRAIGRVQRAKARIPS